MSSATRSVLRCPPPCAAVSQRREAGHCKGGEELLSDSLSNTALPPSVRSYLETAS